MRILQTMNYPAWIKVAEGKQPSHHLFGTDGHILKYEIKENYKCRGYLKDGGYVDFLFVTDKGNFKNFLFCIKLYFKLFKYDAVFDSLCVVTKFLGIFFRFYRPCKLISIIHHPPFNKLLKFTRPDACIFFSEKYKNMADEISPKNVSKHFAIRWQPDKNWYTTKITGIEDKEQKYMFIDNGKTFRDHEMMCEAIYKIGAKTVLINQESAKPKNYIEGKNLDFIILKKPDDEFLLKYLIKSKCILIPAKKDPNKELLGPIGITSFMDAIALGMPVICSNNLCFSEDVDKFTLGITYPAGDEKAFYQALDKMYRDTQFYKTCCYNMKNYAKDKDISIYTKEIWNIIYNCVKK